MAAIREIARGHRIRVLEDSAVSFGSTFGVGEGAAPAGSAGDIGVFSFFRTKPLGGVTDGGMVVTNNDALATDCRWRRNHGQDGITRFLHRLIGTNSRMDELTAHFLLHRLDSLDQRLARRDEIAAIYNRGLAGLAPEIVLPVIDLGMHPHRYVVRSDRRDRLADFLRERGIETETIESWLLPKQPAFRTFADDQFAAPNAERYVRTALGLPFFPSMTNRQVTRVIDGIIAFTREAKH
jgi:dTDP-4-amino-4,6-dideoxygalactose transaminase